MKIDDLFHLYQGNSFELINMKEDSSSEINFVSRTAEDNGVVSHVKESAQKPFPSGLITVALGGSVLSSFVQSHPFYTGFHVMVLSPKKPMTLEEKLFYCHVIKSNAYRYRYGRQANKTLRNLELPPIPSWLKSYKIDFTKIETHNHYRVQPLDTVHWHLFRIGDIFYQERGKEPAPNQNPSGYCPIVNETDSNNGFVRMVQPSHIIKGNAITISINYARNVFYQPKDFCASVNIAVIRNKKLSVGSGLFIATVLRLNNLKYGYGYKISKEKIDNTYIKLPALLVGKNYQPDFQFMENYIKSLPNGDLIQV